MTWFRLGGNARCLFRPRDADDLACLMRRAAEQRVPVKVLGAGANVLVGDDGFDGVVVRLDAPALKRVEQRGDCCTVGGGADLMPLSRGLSDRGWSGLECMAGIPATVGGAVKMNAGGRFGEIGDVIREVVLVDKAGEMDTWSAHRLGLGYRSSNITDQIVVSATMQLAEADPSESGGRYAEYFAFKEQSQPIKDRSAGCVFKNPAGESAGALIDRAGLKGLSCGGAEVSHRHANFIVTRQNAIASDVIRLIDRVRTIIDKDFGIELETEVDIW